MVSDNSPQDNVPQRTVGIEMAEPRSSITEKGEWVVVAMSKSWTKRDGRRGLVDPSGGITVEPPFGYEILLALPLVDNPTEEQPTGTLTLAQYEQRVLVPLAKLNETMLNVKDTGF